MISWQGNRRRSVIPRCGVAFPSCHPVRHGSDVSWLPGPAWPRL